MTDRTINLKEAADIVRHECGEWTGLAETIIRRLKEMPTVDAVPVRCKDCLYWQKSNLFSEHMVCRYVVDCSVVRREDDFCSRGERKDGGGHDGS